MNQPNDPRVIAILDLLSRIGSLTTQLESVINSNDARNLRLDDLSRFFRQANHSLSLAANAALYMVAPVAPSAPPPAPSVPPTRSLLVPDETVAQYEARKREEKQVIERLHIPEL